MIVTLCNAKGGTGKSKLSILLASALAEAGHSAAVLDTDPQQTARRWLESTASDVQLAEDGKSYDALFIDTAPRLDSQRHAVLMGWKSLPSERRARKCSRRRWRSPHQLRKGSNRT